LILDLLAILVFRHYG